MARRRPDSGRMLRVRDEGRASLGRGRDEPSPPPRPRHWPPWPYPQWPCPPLPCQVLLASPAEARRCAERGGHASNLESISRARTLESEGSKRHTHRPLLPPRSPSSSPARLSPSLALRRRCCCCHHLHQHQHRTPGLCAALLPTEQSHSPLASRASATLRPCPLLSVRSGHLWLCTHPQGITAARDPGRRSLHDLVRRSSRVDVVRRCAARTAPSRSPHLFTPRTAPFSSMDARQPSPQMLPKLRYITADEAARIDEALMSARGGFSIDQLMELAGLACAQTVYACYPPDAFPNVLVAAGPGNQGGDGLVAARHLTHFGYSVVVWYPKEGKTELFGVSLCGRHADARWSAKIALRSD